MNEQLMREMFISALKRDNKIFDGFDASNEKTLRLSWNGENLSDINVYVSFACTDEGAMMAQVSCYSLPNFSKQLEAGYRICNQLNDDETIKYYIDGDGDAVTVNTMWFNTHGIASEFSPEQVVNLATMVALSVDEAYPKLERAKWS